MQQQHGAERLRVHARSNNKIRLPLSVPINEIKQQPESSALILSSPQQEEGDNHKDECETRGSHSRAGSNVSHRTASSSIYDYLDALESECTVQLPSTASRAASAPSHRTSFSLDGSSSISRQNTHQYYVGIKEKLATITIELNDKTKTIELLKMARKKDATKMKQFLDEAEDHMKQGIAVQQQKFNKELGKQMDFSQNLVAEKSELAKRCNELVAEIQKANANSAREAERFKMKLMDAKARWAAQEKVRREQWIIKKKEEIKKSTVAALEPDIQLILAKGKADLERAREAASEERQKLQRQIEKERDVALQRLRDDCDRKLVETREKERAKLMLRLDAADAELQQQLSSQRRRLQEEAEVMRNELDGEIRSAKSAHAKEMDEAKRRYLQESQAAVDKLDKEKQDFIAKHGREHIALREETGVECEQFKVQLTRKLRDEMSSEKQAIEKQMLRSRDAKIELVIEKLQEESQQMIERAERKALKKFSQERVEYERKLKQTGEIEGVWMEKNRESHEKLVQLERAYDELKRENEILGHDLRQASAKTSDLIRRLNEERRLHDHSVAQLEKRHGILQTESEQQSVELAALREKQDTMESHFHQQVQKLRGEHDTAIANLHERVKATVGHKDHTIGELQEDMHMLQVKLDKSHAIIEEQRLQIFSQ